MEPRIPEDSARLMLGSIEFSFNDIRTVVETFYRQVEKDPVLSKPFSSVEDWPFHITRLTHFWWVRLGGERYLPFVYNPVEKHFQAGFNQEFLERWLTLFKNTLDRVLTKPQAQVWGEIATRMGGALSMKNEMYKEAVEGRKKSE